MTFEIHNVDLTRTTFAIGDQVIQWSSTSSIGEQLGNLKEGQQVRVVGNTSRKNTLVNLQVVH